MGISLIKRIARSFIGGWFFVFYALGSLFIGGLVFPPLVLFNARKLMRKLVLVCWKLFIFIAEVTRTIRVEISDEDREKLTTARGMVIVANHLTLIDVIVLGVFFHDVTAVVKAAAGANFFYSLVVKGVFLMNNDPMRVMDEARERLREGVNLIVFPQGTRTPRGVERPLRRGAAQIALHAGATILPVAMECDPPVLAKGQPWHDLSDHTIVWRLKVKDPIQTSSNRSLSAHSAAVAITEEIRLAIRE